MQLKTPTPLGEEEQKGKEGRESITDRFLSIAKRKKEDRTVSFPDIYLPKRNIKIKKNGSDIKLKAPTPLDVKGVEGGSVESIESNPEIPKAFIRDNYDKKKYRRKKVDDEVKLKQPQPLGQKQTPPRISLKDIKTNPFLKNLNPRNLLLKIKGIKSLPIVQKYNPLSLIKNIKLTKEQKKKVTYASIVTVPLLLLLSLAIAILIYTRSQPYTLAKEFLQSIEQNDVDRAYEMTTDAYRAVTTKKDFNKLVVRLNSVDLANAKRKKKKIVNEGAMGKYAYIRYKVSGYYVDITVFNDESDWGIHSIELSIID